MGDEQALGQVGSLTEEQNQKLELVRAKPFRIIRSLTMNSAISVSNCN